jgi:Tol biopolymer transport system component
MKSRPLWNRDEDITGVRVSPDGKQLSLWVSGKEGGLYVLDIETGEERRVVKLPGSQSRGNGGGDYAWSPDMKWIAYAARSASRAWNIFVVPLSGGDPVNVTRLYAEHSNPAWSPDGKYLYFQSDREGSGLYALPLQREPVRSFDADLKFEKPGTNVPIKIDFDDISRRIRKLASQTPQGEITVAPDGTILFISENDIWSVTYDGKDTKRLTTGGGKSALRVAKEGKKISYIQSGDIYDGAGRRFIREGFVHGGVGTGRARRTTRGFHQFWNA